MWSFLFALHLLLYLGISSGNTSRVTADDRKSAVRASPQPNAAADTSIVKTIHVLVALCDNQYQGIVPAPAKIGNGQDPDNNLYWGCGYGVRTYFKKSAEWKLLQKIKGDSLVMERLIFKHSTKDYYLVADAYNGKYIRQCTIDYLYACAGRKKEILKTNNISLGLFGNAKLLAYTGHDGLMDFRLEENFRNIDGRQRDAIVLACISKSYFAPYLEQAKARPLVWTTGLLCPEAYTLHDALTGYVAGESAEQIRSRAAKAYTKYHKCGENAARHLLVTGK